MSGRVSVSGYRHLLEPPELGDCQDPECRTWATGADFIASRNPWTGDGTPPGRGLLLVAMYADADQSSWSRVCANCDERILRRWLAEQ